MTPEPSTQYHPEPHDTYGVVMRCYVNGRRTSAFVPYSKITNQFSPQLIKKAKALYDEEMNKPF